MFLLCSRHEAIDAYKFRGGEKIGLDISGLRSELTYHAGYSGLHQIRAIAVMVADKCDTFQEAFDYLMLSHEKDELWNKDYYAWLEREGLLDFRQLLHFSDSEGFLLTGWVLRDIDYKHSMSLGSLDKLNTELERIRIEITSHPEKYKLNESVMHLFWMIYDLVKDESEQHGCLEFH